MNKLFTIQAIRTDLIIIIILAFSGYSIAQNCNYVLDLADNASFSQGCSGPSSSSTLTDEVWSVQGTLSNTNICTLAPSLGLAHCSASTLELNISLNISAPLSAGELVVIQIFNSFTNSWEDIIFNASDINAQGSNLALLSTLINPYLYVSDPDKLSFQVILISNGTLLTINTGGITLGPQVLPLQLISFEGKANTTGTNTLKWETEQEESVSHFEILRSIDGDEWELAGEVEAENFYNGATYRFVDNPLNQGNYYYKLAMVDLDGSIDYSTVLHLKPSRELDFEVFSSVASDYVQVAYPSISPSTKVYIFDAFGRFMKEENLTQVLTSIQVDTFIAGIYYISIIEDGEIETRSFVKM